MAADQNEAQKARAERLRARVKDLVEGKPQKGAAPQGEAPPESPRDFIHRRMAKKKRGGGK